MIISVIVPVYKVEAYLDRCVRSIIDQTYPSLDIILVDDGSPDNCPAMCDAWAKKDRRIRVIHKPNGGLSDARNTGVAAAKGEYISFIDSDDWIAPEMLDRLMHAMERDDSDIAACAVEMVWEDGRPGQMLTGRKNCVLDQHDAQRALLRENTLKQPVWYKLYRKETIEAIPFPVGKYHEDVFWSYQAVGKARRVSLIDYVGYFYFQRSDSIMGEGYSLKRLDALEALTKRHACFLETEPDLELEARISIFFGCMYHGQMAIKHLRGQEKAAAIRRVKSVVRQYRLSLRECSCRKPSQRLWLMSSQISLPLTCRVRNMLHIGF